MALLSKTQQRLLGIDISSTAIKLIELSRSESKGHHEYRVDAFASGNLPPGSVDARKIKDTAAVSEVITEVVSRSGSSAKQAAVAVSGAAVISRVIQLPAGLSELEMESMVSLEADHYIPQRLDEVRYDFDVIGPSQNNPETVDVLLAAARGDVVDDLIMVLENAGLTAQVVDAEQYAVEHCYQELVRFDQDSGNVNNVAVIDIGANTTVDRGSLDDTVIEEGVKIDNQVQVAHNVVIGAHTAIAGCVGISGSARIGSHCALAGGVPEGRTRAGRQLHALRAPRTGPLPAQCAPRCQDFEGRAG